MKYVTKNFASNQLCAENASNMTMSGGKSEISIILFVVFDDLFEGLLFKISLYFSNYLDPYSYFQLDYI